MDKYREIKHTLACDSVHSCLTNHSCSKWKKLKPIVDSGENKNPQKNKKNSAHVYWFTFVISREGEKNVQYISCAPIL